MRGFSAEGVKEVRVIGGCVCIECENSDFTRGFEDFAYDNGVFSRPFLRYIYAMPPYVIPEEDFVKILGVMKEFTKHRTQTRAKTEFYKVFGGEYSSQPKKEHRTQTRTKTEFYKVLGREYPSQPKKEQTLSGQA